MISAEHLVSLGVGLVDNQRKDSHYDNLGNRRTDISPGGQLLTLVGILRHRGGHRSIGDIHPGVADGAPEDIGNCHPGNLNAHGSPRHIGGKDQKTGNCDRPHEPADPGSEFALGGIGAPVNDLSHSHISKCIYKLPQHHQDPHQDSGHAHDIGVELQHKESDNHKGQIVGEIAGRVTDLIRNAKGLFRPLLKFVHHRFLTSISHFILLIMKLQNIFVLSLHQGTILHSCPIPASGNHSTRLFYPT